jgi:hypothetical protein
LEMVLLYGVSRVSLVRYKFRCSSLRNQAPESEFLRSHLELSYAVINHHLSLPLDVYASKSTHTAYACSPENHMYRNNISISLHARIFHHSTHLASRLKRVLMETFPHRKRNPPLSSSAIRRPKKALQNPRKTPLRPRPKISPYVLCMHANIFTRKCSQAIHALTSISPVSTPFAPTC